jgi:hypothetical protein
MRKYPLGLQDFEGIINEGYLYVDKTKYIYNLNEGGKYYFLSRPRRFGKSMLTNTIKALYEGKRHLFKGLYVEDKWNWAETYPVIRISFADINFEKKGLVLAIQDALQEVADLYDIKLISKEIASIFKELLQKLSLSRDRVVVIIDEYDKPIIHYLGKDTAQAIAHRDILKNFYSILKDADAHLKLVFITGISKFAKVSIFSDLNNLSDITTSKKFSGICGITEEELETKFVEELKEHNIKKIKQWYNGYTWDMKVWMYNPFSLMHFFNEGEYKNFWFESGTPTFLINLLKGNNQYNFDSREASMIKLSSFDVEKLEVLPLMFQTGYLTLSSYDEESELYTLNFPNREVQKSFNEVLLDAYMEYPQGDGGIVLVNKLRSAFLHEQYDDIKHIINTLFKSLPYTLWQNENEAFFHAILHLTFKLLGIYVQSEVLTADGSIDSIIHFADKIYCIEFKLDKSAKEALHQIKDKGYLEPYRHEGKRLIAIGVNFSREHKTVEEMEVEEV